MADGRHQAVVHRRRRSPRAARRSADTRPVQALVEHAARALGRSQVPGRALEQVRRARARRPTPPRPRADGRRRTATTSFGQTGRREAVEHRALGRADVGHDAVAAALERFRTAAPSAPTGAQTKQTSAPSTASSTTRAALVDRAPLERRRERALARVEAADASAPSMRSRAARPIEPPIRPTPMTAIFRGRSRSQSADSSLPTTAATRWTCST